MDVKKPKIQSGEPLPLTDRIYRYGKNDLIDKEDKFKPSINFFELSTSDKKTDIAFR